MCRYTAIGSLLGMILLGSLPGRGGGDSAAPTAPVAGQSPLAQAPAVAPAVAPTAPTTPSPSAPSVAPPSTPPTTASGLPPAPTTPSTGLPPAPAAEGPVWQYQHDHARSFSIGEDRSAAGLRKQSFNGLLWGVAHQGLPSILPRDPNTARLPIRTPIKFN